MKRTILIALAIVLAVVALFAWLPSRAQQPQAIDAASIASTTVVQIDPGPQPQAPQPPAVDPLRAPLIDYLVTSMRSWRRPTKASANYESVAADIVDVAQRDDEPAFWSNDADKSQTMIMVATIAFFEGGFVDYADRGLCNDLAWAHSTVGKNAMLSGGDCDGGLSKYRALAWSLWQIHPDEGIVLKGDGWTRASNMDATWRKDHANEIVDGPMTVADRKVAVRVALHMLRQAVPNGLRGYTGEDGEFAPKAHVRYDFARNWVRSHPFKHQ